MLSGLGGGEWSSTGRTGWCAVSADLVTSVQVPKPCRGVDGRAEGNARYAREDPVCLSQFGSFFQNKTGLFSACTCVCVCVCVCVMLQLKLLGPQLDW